ncbi:hypothetical protein SCUCBS95973_007965 [Sporothrix curviconia]|uniref:Uncharacterized protein n=1 Tax=Sporothrix curviconia TaxID=1260050 RepID=A0ABP0CK66_9PEZI
MSAARAAGHLRTAHRPRTAASTFLRSMSSSPSCASPKGPFRLVTVNSQPERAKNVVTQVIARLQDRFAIVYAGNIAFLCFVVAG